MPICVARAGALALIVAAFGVGPLGRSLGQDVKPKPLPEAIIKAWTDAGAQVGWIREGPIAFAQFVQGGTPREGDVPGFRFATWRAGVVAKLPQPQQPFGLDFRFTKGVTDEAVKELAGLKELQSLSLEYTDVTTVCVNELTGMKGLKRLNLGHSKARPEGLQELATLKGLRALNFWHNGLRDADVKVLVRALPELQGLDISASPGGVTDACMKELAGLKRLQSLSIRYTSLTDAGLKELAGLKALRALSIGGPGSKLTDAGLKELAVLTELQTLHVTYDPQLTDASLKVLAGIKELAGLKEIYLRHTSVTDTGLTELTAFKELQRLELGGTKVTEAGMKELRKALPKCTIIR
jgi:internalin A